MSKLSKLKDWLSISDAARLLSTSLQEAVKEADVLQLALDRKLVLSARLAGQTEARPGKLVSYSEAQRVDCVFPVNGKSAKIPAGVVVSDDEVFEPEERIVWLGDIVDLPMVGGERNDVERAYRTAAAEPLVDLVSIDGTFVMQDGRWFQLQTRFTTDNKGKPFVQKEPRNHPDNFYPAGALPEDFMFIVKPSAIADFLQAAGDPSESLDRPLGERERKTLLVIIAALAKEAGLDISSHVSKTGQLIERLTDQLGCHVARRTIEEHLKRVPTAIDNRSTKER